MWASYGFSTSIHDQCTLAELLFIPVCTNLQFSTSPGLWSWCFLQRRVDLCMISGSIPGVGARFNHKPSRCAWLRKVRVVLLQAMSMYPVRVSENKPRYAHDSTRWLGVSNLSISTSNSLSACRLDSAFAQAALVYTL